MEKQRGFTLIELLVVIAIIGILSAVVLASLSTARQKGNDASVQANLSTIQTQAEIWSGNNGYTYNSGTAISSAVCSTLTTANSIMADTNIQNALKSAKNAAGSDSDCGINGTNYSIASPMGTSGIWWCIDSNGNARKQTATGGAYTALTGSATAAHTASGATVCN